MKYIPSIGLEIHVFLNSTRKVFSPEDIGSYSWTSLGFPGTLPSINIDSVKKTIQLSSVLNCETNYYNILFDRKNYFYYDLPRGYQITQHFHPIGKNGFIKLSSGKKIRIQQIHLEEDTAQQFKKGGKIGLAFERLGRPLAEVVTYPDFESYEEIEEFLKKFRMLCSFNDISSVLYEEGEMRIDLNISTRKTKEEPMSKTKSEIKNLNSLFALKTSINYILDIQEESLLKGESYESLTYSWVSKTKTCEVMRKKGGESDYFYIPEANIPKIFFSKEQYKNLLENLIFDYDEFKLNLDSFGLKPPEVDNLMNKYELFNLVSKLNSKLNNWSTSYNWIGNIVSGISPSLANISYEDIESVILDVEHTKKISLRIAKDMLKEIILNKLTYKQALKILKVSFISDEASLRKLLEEVCESYESQILSLIGNLPKLERMIIGECMKRSNGQADPKELSRIFAEFVKKYL